MKKIIFLALMCLPFVVFSQKISDQEIAEIIFKSKEVNRTENGVYNPDLIFPGNNLTYQLTDGQKTIELIIPIKAGDTQWSIAEKVLEQQDIHKMKVVDYPNDPFPNTPPPTADKLTDPATLNVDWWETWPFLLFLSFGLAVIALWAVLRGRKKHVPNANPLVEGGVSDANAVSYMESVANRQFGPNVELVGPVVKGRLTSIKLVNVLYTDGWKKESFKNELAFRSLARIDGQEHYVYYKQICGNDVRPRILMQQDNLIFIPEAVPSEELNKANHQHQVERVAQQASAVVAAVNIQTVDPSKMMDSMAKILENKQTGEFNIILNQEGLNIKASFSNKVAPKKSTRKTPVKTN